MKGLQPLHKSICVRWHAFNVFFSCPLPVVSPSLLPCSIPLRFPWFRCRDMIYFDVLKRRYKPKSNQINVFFSSFQDLYDFDVGPLQLPEAIV